MQRSDLYIADFTHVFVATAMSALGQKQTSAPVRMMSALPPKADIGTLLRNVRYVPKADKVQCSKLVWLLDHLVGERKKFTGRSIPVVFALLRLNNEARGIGYGKDSAQHQGRANAAEQIPLAVRRPQCGAGFGAGDRLGE